MKQFLVQALIIIVAGLVTGLAFALSSPVQLHLPKDINSDINPAPRPIPGVTGPSGTTGGSTAPSGDEAQPPTGPTGSPSTELEVSLARAKQIFDAQQAVFIDARPQDEYLKSHIPGAMHLEKDALNGPPPAKVLNYLPGMTVVVYCHGELCTDSQNVIKRLHALNKGIGPFHIIKDGFPGWEKAGHPVMAGPEVGFE